MSPDFVLEPGPDAIDVMDMIKDTAHGLVVYQSYQAHMDMQLKNGVYPAWRAREIVNGKVGKEIVGGGVMFHTPTFWKNVVAIGGKATVQTNSKRETKGQPPQSSGCGVSVVPIKAVKDCNVIDMERHG